MDVNPVNEICSFPVGGQSNCYMVFPECENLRGGVSSHDHGELWPEKEFRKEETPAGNFAIFAGQILPQQPAVFRTT